jgi:hypothetical protein
MLIQGGDISLLFFLCCKIPSNICGAFQLGVQFFALPKFQFFFLAYIYYFVDSKQRLYIHNIFAYLLTRGFIYFNHELYCVKV